MKDMPLGLGIALKKNNAINAFLSLPLGDQQRIIDKAHFIQSKSEMQSYVQAIIKNEIL